MNYNNLKHLYYLCHRFVAGLFAIALFILSCTDKTSQGDLPGCIISTSNVENLWILLGVKSNNKDTHSIVFTLQTDSPDMPYLHERPAM